MFEGLPSGQVAAYSTTEKCIILILKFGCGSVFKAEKKYPPKMVCVYRQPRRKRTPDQRQIKVRSLCLSRSAQAELILLLPECWPHQSA